MVECAVFVFKARGHLENQLMFDALKVPTDCRWPLRFTLMGASLSQD
jgi:hypothetical protein